MVKKNRLLAPALLFTLLAAVSVPGASSSNRPHNALLNGGQNSQNTNKLTSEINWHRSLAQAEGVARSQGKMIFWVNILGTLAGAT